MELPPPRDADVRDFCEGLAYELRLPLTEPPWPGMLILHGAGSRKENHADFARASSDAGFAALTFDARGHGDSEGPMGAGALDDVRRMARLLASTEGVDPGRICIRGSSMGGYFALHATAIFAEIAACVAICPAGEDQLLRGLRSGSFDFDADVRALEAWLSEHDIRDTVAEAGKPILIIHAEGDEQIPYTQSRELAEAGGDDVRLIVLPGGHHRSAQHDPEVQGEALRWARRHLP